MQSSLPYFFFFDSGVSRVRDLSAFSKMIRILMKECAIKGIMWRINNLRMNTGSKSCLAYLQDYNKKFKVLRIEHVKLPPTSD